MSQRQYFVTPLSQIIITLVSYILSIHCTMSYDRKDFTTNYHITIFLRNRPNIDKNFNAPNKII